MSAFTGTITENTADEFRPVGAGVAKWMIEFDRDDETGNVAVTYQPAGFANPVIPPNNSIDIAVTQVIWIQAPINAAKIIITPTSVSAPVTYRATPYMD